VVFAKLVGEQLGQAEDHARFVRRAMRIGRLVCSIEHTATNSSTASGWPGTRKSFANRRLVSVLSSPAAVHSTPAFVRLSPSAR
jgi:hypothetical protein